VVCDGRSPTLADVQVKTLLVDFPTFVTDIQVRMGRCV
jgi:hypothetical protein